MGVFGRCTASNYPSFKNYGPPSFRGRASKKPSTPTPLKITHFMTQKIWNSENGISALWTYHLFLWGIISVSLLSSPRNHALPSISPCFISSSDSWSKTLSLWSISLPYDTYHRIATLFLPYSQFNIAQHAHTHTHVLYSCSWIQLKFAQTLVF